MHVREDKKVEGLPALQQVPQMLAAGWGGVGTVTATIATRCDFEEDFDTPAFFSRNEILSDIRKHSDSLTSQVGLESLCDVLNCLNNAVLAGADFMQGLSDRLKCTLLAVI